jgi:hypothetical protein
MAVVSADPDLSEAPRGVGEEAAGAWSMHGGGGRDRLGRASRERPERRRSRAGCGAVCPPDGRRFAGQGYVKLMTRIGLDADDA